MPKTWRVQASPSAPRCVVSPAAAAGFGGRCPLVLRPLPGRDKLNLPAPGGSSHPAPHTLLQEKRWIRKHPDNLVCVALDDDGHLVIDKTRTIFLSQRLLDTTQETLSLSARVAPPTAVSAQISADDFGGWDASPGC